MKPNSLLRNIVAATLTVLPLSAQFLRHVDARAAASGDGSTWASAYRTLDEALAEARGALVGYEVWVWMASGEYSPEVGGGGLAAPHWELPGTVSVYGGFAGFETTLGERDIDANEVVLDGHLRSGSMRRTGALLTVDGGNPRLDGLTIRGCDRSNDGAALVVRSGTPTLSRCNFVDNLSSGSGGAIAVLGDSLACLDCVFRGNSAEHQGGAVYGTSAARIEFDSCEFVLNIGGEDGGAILAAGGAVLTSFGPDEVAGSGDEDLRLSPGSPCVDASSSVAGGELGDADCGGQPRGVDGNGT
ncbi:MAG: hypothetical protein IPM13_19455, partial [Phycisphaerales bacterium]|nr:hypothetical protein [Phycisphaerales bacterium]